MRRKTTEPQPRSQCSPREQGMVCPPGKVSLAMERDSFTFLSNLVRTSLACLILRLPTENL